MIDGANLSIAVSSDVAIAVRFKKVSTVMPDGAFYAWADCSEACMRLNQKFGTQLKDSWDFSFEVMRRAHVAVTPGRDFGVAQTGNFVRFSTASSLAELKIAIERLTALLA
mgnify:CR=1 FL=1